MATRPTPLAPDTAESVPSATTPLAQWLRWLEGRRGTHIELGLERCKTVADALGLTRPAPVVVTVAGTNGKGSSVALLESVWRSAGHRIATYTSPHLLHYSERIRIGGEPVEEARICAAFAAVEQARGSVPLTYFEFATLAALLIFERAALDVVILEVGLGGRLDAVNIVDCDVALIAAIGLDHEDWLGETREAIGGEKAGIMRAGRPAVCSDHEVPDSIPQTAAELDADLRLLGAEFAYESVPDGWTWWNNQVVHEGLPLPGLDGAHQLRNAAGVIEVLELLRDRLPIDRAAIEQGLTEVSLKGRFHRVHGARDYVMDVAHNPQAAEMFTATLRTMPAAPTTHAVVGMLNTKNHAGFFRPLLEHVDVWHFADLPGPTGATASDLAAALTQQGGGQRDYTLYGSVTEAHDGALRATAAGDRILVIGSCITVGEMMEVLRRGSNAECAEEAAERG